jgi:hypothetical protein
MKEYTVGSGSVDVKLQAFATARLQICFRAKVLEQRLTDDFEILKKV